MTQETSVQAANSRQPARVPVCLYMPFTSRFHAVVAMASETLQTKSKARRGEFVFGASMSASAIGRSSTS